MEILLVVNHPERWPLEIPGITVVSAKSYLTDRVFGKMHHWKVFNLCRSYRYQSMGYYVSLIAEARGHKPQPSVTTIMDFTSSAMTRLLTEDLEELIRKSLRPIHSDEFSVSIYFGKNMAKRYANLSKRLYNIFQAPFIRAHFARKKDSWVMKSVGPISSNEVPESHRDFVANAATEYFSKRRRANRTKTSSCYDLAILTDPKETQPPSNQKALQQFVKEAAKIGLNTEFITQDDIGRLAEFDALFIRTTTRVNHFSYQFARRAYTEGLEVIDDPVSITRCANKVFLAEQLSLHGIPTPKTLILHKKNLNLVESDLGFPCVLKQPDSQFSLGVRKVESKEELAQQLEELFKISDLVVAQAYMRTDFDWRVGILDKKPLFACKYFMAPHHWQIIKQDAVGDDRYGDVDTVAVENVPEHVVKAALKAACLMGNGLYGVDLKEYKGRVFVIEVNDNPNIDSGFEDLMQGKELYRNIAAVFMDRIRRRKGINNA